MAAAKHFKMDMSLDRETPGTVRYKEDIDEKPITLYLRKKDVEKLGSPEDIEVTVTPK